MNFIDSIIRVINAPRVIEQQSVLIDKLNQQIKKMNMDINLLDSSIEDFKKALYTGEFVGREWVETRIGEELENYAIAEHDHDGELAREDHEHETLANEDHDHDLSDDVARIVRNKLIEVFEEITSNI
jgi:hypothetical protein